MAFEHRHPARALQLDGVIPLVVMHRVGHGRAAFERVDRHAFLIQEKLGLQHPDFLGVVAGEFVVDLVDHLHHGDFLANLLRSPGRFQRLGLVVFFGLPHGAVVVAVDRTQDVGAGIELRQAPGQVMHQLDPQIPAGLRGIEFGLCRTEELDALLHPGMRIARLAFEQRTRKPVDEITDVLRLGIVGRRMQRQPGFPHVRELPDGERFHAGILECLNDGHLQRGQHLHRQRFLAERQVRGAMVGGGAIQLHTRHDLVFRRGVPQRTVVVVSVGNVDDEALDIGLQTLARFIVTRSRAQEKIPPPHRAQINVQATLHVDEQRALALLLQHRHRIGALQREIFLLAFEIGLVGLRAPHHPAAQATQGQLGQQAVEVFQHGAQTARGLRQHDGQHVEIIAEDVLVAQTLGRKRRSAGNQRQHLARGFRRHTEQKIDDVRQHVLADGACNLGHGLKVGDHHLFAPPQVVQGYATLHEVVQPARRERARSLVPRTAQDVLRVAGKLVEQLAVLFDVDGHGGVRRQG